MLVYDKTLELLRGLSVEIGSAYCATAFEMKLFYVAELTQTQYRQWL
jgi:hypothetical protein